MSGTAGDLVAAVWVATGTAERPGVLPAQALDHATGHLAAAVVLRALGRGASEGGGGHGELSLAQTAHWLLGTEGRPEETEPGRPEPYLVELPSARGRVTVVWPPGSPSWTEGASFPADARWRRRNG